MGEIINNDYIKDCLSPNPLYIDDIGNADTLAKMKTRTNFEPWEPVPVEPWAPMPAYNGFSLSDSESEEETLEEVIRRVVKEAVGQITEEGTLVAPEIEKYHIKHR